MKTYVVRRTTIVLAIFPLLFSLVVASCNRTGSSRDVTEAEFRNPGREHYPETWYHFIGGNVSKAGITADLEAIAAAGISGIQFFHGQFGGAWPGVDPQIGALSEDWDELVQWTAEECKRLNLRFTMQNCPGWSYAGDRGSSRRTPCAIWYSPGPISPVEPRPTPSCPTPAVVRSHGATTATCS